MIYGKLTFKEEIIMYQIENKSDIFVEHYVGRFHRTYKIDRIGTE